MGFHSDPESVQIRDASEEDRQIRANIAASFQVSISKHHRFSVTKNVCVIAIFSLTLRLKIPK
jgi:hypothetical protein